MFKTPNDKQSVDPRCGLIYPWYTEPCLKILSMIVNKNSDVFEWGGGCSTVWYSFNARTVTTLENDQEWASEISDYLDEAGKTNYHMKVINVPASANSDHANKHEYLNYIESLNKTYDLIIVDGSYRDDALRISEKYVRNGGYLIFDNYLQDTSGYKTLPSAEIINKKYRSEICEQPGYFDWKTAIWRIER